MKPPKPIKDPNWPYLTNCICEPIVAGVFDDSVELDHERFEGSEALNVIMPVKFVANPTMLVAKPPWMKLRPRSVPTELVNMDSIRSPWFKFPPATVTSVQLREVVLYMAMELWGLESVKKPP